MSSKPDIRILIPEMPTADALLPFLRQIDTNKSYTNFGPLEKTLRGELANTINASNPPHIVTVANATLGLELCLLQLGLAPGSKVCIPAFTFPATATAVQRVGLNVCLADIDSDRWVMTPEIVEDALKRDTFDAVIVVATFGEVADPEEWDQFFRKTGIPVIIDAAAALGSQKPGRRCPAVFSLHATKGLGAGEGGFIATYDDNCAKQYMSASSFGIDFEHPDRLVTGPGTNAKLSEYHAAVALAGLQTWDQRLRSRQSLHAAYTDYLAAYAPGAVLQRFNQAALFNYMNIRFAHSVSTDTIRKQMEDAGIETRRWYLPLIHNHPAFSGAQILGPIQHSIDLSQSLVSIPFHTNLTDADLVYITRTLQGILSDLL